MRASTCLRPPGRWASTERPTWARSASRAFIARRQVVPFARVKQDCELAGFRIPKGWKAVAGLNTSIQDAIGFSEPERFDPDRFTPGRFDLARQPTPYVVHGGGTHDGHRCAGEWLADAILRAFAMGLLYDHTFELPPQDLRLRPAGLCPLPVDGLRMRVRRA